MFLNNIGVLLYSSILISLIIKTDIFLNYVAPTVTVVQLYIQRKRFFEKDWQFMLLEFCFCVNMFNAFRGFWKIEFNLEIEKLIFVISFGPVLLSAIFFKNKLCLYSTDLVFPCFTHILPSVISWIRVFLFENIEKVENVPQFSINRSEI